MRPAHEQGIADQIPQARQSVADGGLRDGQPPQLPLAWLMGVHFGFGLIGMAVCRLLLFAAEALIVATLWRNGLWIGGAINQTGSTIISTARQRP